MLAQLSIRNFALIDNLTVEFGRGFNVITGETGAGKSILIDAISATVGDRIAPGAVRSGSDRAQVEALFEFDGRAPESAAGWLEDGAVILCREISAGGRGAFRLNGRLCSGAAVRQAADGLVDLYGQHEHQSLLSTEKQADFVDASGTGAALDTRTLLREQFRSLTETAAHLERLKESEREGAQRADLYRFQIQEIDAAGLDPGEEAALEADRLLLANAEKIHGSCGSALETLSGKDPSAMDLLAEAAMSLDAALPYDGRLETISALLQSSLINAQEAAREISAYHASVEFNPDRLEAVLQRIDLIRGLKRKYGDSIPAILEHRRRAAEDLAAVEQTQDREEELVRRLEDLEAQLAETSSRLARDRERAARKLEGAVCAELRQLGMEKARFAVALQPGDGRAWRRGWAAVAGQVEFRISPNPGEPLAPLARIASGGELSRLMLALRSVTSASGPGPALIFDEIDAGVGGRTAATLGRRLADLARTNQVLCVTHLPQIASMADTHLHVWKEASGSRTVVRLRRLEGGSRVAELARMLGGAESTATLHAEQLLAEARAEATASR